MGRPKQNFHDQYEIVTESGCWIWLGGVNADGYGCMSGNRKAHRVSHEMTFGPIPSGMCVCHRCDVRPCVNPRHLFLGTDAQNNADKVQKKRHVFGRKTHTAKLTENDVLAILSGNEPCFVLAARFGVSDASISYIRLGKTWKHIARPDGFSYTPYRAPGNHTKYQEVA